MGIKIIQENYSTYKKVFEVINQRLYKGLNNVLPPETNPIAVLNSWEAKSKAIARRGLQAGLNDCLGSISHYPKETISDINTELEKNLLPSIYILSGIIQKTIKHVLKTKKIKNIDQYYIVKEILDDMASEISVDDRNSLSDFLRDFEYTTSR
jgi:hypothetical protein